MMERVLVAVEVVRRVIGGVYAGLRAFAGLPSSSAGPAVDGGEVDSDRDQVLAGRLPGSVASSSGPAIGQVFSQGPVVVGSGPVTIAWAGQVAGQKMAGEVAFNGLPAMAGGEWSPGELRRLAMAVLDDSRLMNIAFDYFPRAFRAFTAGMSFDDKVRRLVDQVFLDSEVPWLLSAIRAFNPRGFDREVAKRAGDGGAGSGLT